MLHAAQLHEHEEHSPGADDTLRTEIKEEWFSCIHHDMNYRPATTTLTLTYANYLEVNLFHVFQSLTNLLHDTHRGKLREAKDFQDVCGTFLRLLQDEEAHMVGERHGLLGAYGLWKTPPFGLLHETVNDVLIYVGL